MDYLTNLFRAEQTLGQKKQERLSEISRIKKQMLDPGWQELPEESFDQLDADTFRLDTGDIRLAGPSGGYRPDSYETEPRRYLENPARFEQHRKSYGQRYNVDPSKVGVEDLVREGKNQKEQIVEMLKGGAQYRLTGETGKQGRQLAQVRTADGVDLGSFLSSRDNNADYDSKFNARQRLEDVQSGATEAFENARRDRTPGEFLRDTAINAAKSVVSLGEMGNWALNMMTGGVASNLFNKGDEIGEDIQGWLDALKSKPGQGRRQIMEDRLASWSQGKERRIQERIADGDSPTLAKAKEFVDGFAEATAIGLNDPGMVVDMAVESIGLGGVVSIAGKAAYKATLKNLMRKAAKEGKDFNIRAPEVQKALQKAQSRAGIGATGVIGGLATGEQTYSEIMQLSEEQLKANSPAYNELREEGKTHKEAQQTLANQGSIFAGFIGGVAGAGIAKFTGAADLQAGLFTGLGQKAATGTLLGATKRGVQEVGKQYTEEVFQEGAEQTAQNIGVKTTADETKDLTEGVAQSAALGGLAGGVTAIGVGAPKAVATTARVGKEAAGTLKEKADKARSEAPVPETPTVTAVKKAEAKKENTILAPDELDTVINETVRKVETEGTIDTDQIAKFRSAVDQKTQAILNKTKTNNGQLSKEDTDELGRLLQAKRTVTQKAIKPDIAAKASKLGTPDDTPEARQEIEEAVRAGVFTASEIESFASNNEAYQQIKARLDAAEAEAQYVTETTTGRTSTKAKVIKEKLSTNTAGLPGALGHAQKIRDRLAAIEKADTPDAQAKARVQAEDVYSSFAGFINGQVKKEEQYGAAIEELNALENYTADDVTAILNERSLPKLFGSDRTDKDRIVRFLNKTRNEIKTENELMSRMLDGLVTAGFDLVKTRKDGKDYDSVEAFKEKINAKSAVKNEAQRAAVKNIIQEADSVANAGDVVLLSNIEENSKEELQRRAGKLERVLGLTANTKIPPSNVDLTPEQQKKYTDALEEIYEQLGYFKFGNKKSFEWKLPKNSVPLVKTIDKRLRKIKKLKNTESQLAALGILKRFIIGKPAGAFSKKTGSSKQDQLTKIESRIKQVERIKPTRPTRPTKGNQGSQNKPSNNPSGNPSGSEKSEGVDGMGLARNLVTNPEDLNKVKRVLVYSPEYMQEKLNGALASTLVNEDGSYTIRLNSQITSQQVKDHLNPGIGEENPGKISTIKKQKAIVTKYLLDKYGVDLVSILNEQLTEDIIGKGKAKRFMLYHELGHIANEDHVVVDGVKKYDSDKNTNIATEYGIDFTKLSDKERRYLTDSAIRAEANAHIFALNKLDTKVAVKPDTQVASDRQVDSQADKGNDMAAKRASLAALRARRAQTEDCT
jgi:hypothetical protein